MNLSSNADSFNKEKSQIILIAMILNQQIIDEENEKILEQITTLENLTEEKKFKNISFHPKIHNTFMEYTKMNVVIVLPTWNQINKNLHHTAVLQLEIEGDFRSKFVKMFQKI